MVRDYIHIRDVAAAMRTALTAPDLPGGAYNIGSGTGHSINDIFEAIRRTTGTGLELRHRPARGFDVDTIVLDTGRFRAATGWAPAVDLETGIAELWDILTR